MPKPTTGRIRPVEKPQPDTEAMTTNTLMASVFTGLSLIVSTFVLSLFGSIGLYSGRSFGQDPITGAQIGMALGLTVGLFVIGVVLRKLETKIRKRSANLYRGAWIGLIFSFVIIIVMAYAPGLIPSYCPPGAAC